MFGMSSNISVQFSPISLIQARTSEDNFHFIYQRKNFLGGGDKKRAWLGLDSFINELDDVTEELRNVCGGNRAVQRGESLPNSSPVKPGAATGNTVHCPGAVRSSGEIKIQTITNHALCNAYLHWEAGNWSSRQDWDQFQNFGSGVPSDSDRNPEFSAQTAKRNFTSENCCVGK